MAVRTSGSDVKDILDTDLAAGDLTPFIADASLIVDEIADQLGTDRAKSVEKWLSAHLASLRDRRAARVSGAGASMTYQGQTGMGIDATDYGQQADLLSGGLLRAVMEDDSLDWAVRDSSEDDVD